MIKKYTLLFATLLLIVTSCSRGNEIIEPVIQENQTNILKYIAGYMIYENLNSDGIVTIDFINSKPAKRTIPNGNFSVIGGSTNVYDDSLYEDLSYSGNTITILQKSSNPNTIINNGKKIITTDNTNIIKKEYFDQNNVKYYETQYQYLGNKLISYSNYKPFYTGGMYLFSKSEIFYNDQNNVDNIVTKKSEYNNNTGIYDFDSTTLKRSVESFSNYDQIANPLKNLGLFDELFYRSLSTNNFKNYELKSYDETGSANGATAQRSWTFVYENGQINFAK